MSNREGQEDLHSSDRPEPDTEHTEATQHGEKDFEIDAVDATCQAITKTRDSSLSSVSQV